MVKLYYGVSVDNILKIDENKAFLKKRLKKMREIEANWNNKMELKAWFKLRNEIRKLEKELK